MKALPFLTVDEYLWGRSSSFYRLMAYDQSRVRFLSQKEIDRRRREKENERNRVFTADDVFKRLGMDGKKDGGPKGDWKAMLSQKEQDKNQQNEIDNGTGKPA